MYVDQFLAYAEATANIELNGNIVADPKTNQPLQNPYLGIRNSSRRAMLEMRITGTAQLWAVLEAPAAAAKPSPKPRKR